MKQLYTLLFIFCNIYFISAQTGNVGIGTSSPDGTSVLDITATDKGMLVPRVALTALNAIGPIKNAAGATATNANMADGLLVYNIANAGAAPNIVTPGYYYWDKPNNKWVRVGNSKDNDWTVANTTATPAIKTDNQYVTGNVGVGDFSIKNPLNKLHILHTSNTDGLLLQNNTGGASATTNINFATYADIVAGTSRPGASIKAIDNGDYSANLTFNTKAPGADVNALEERMRITTKGPVLGTSFTGNGLNFKIALGTDNNKWFTVQLDNDYGLSNISIFAASYFDGNIGINGIPLIGLLNNGSTGWYYQSANSTTSQSSANGNADNVYHYAFCPDNYIATGVEMYATGSYLDYGLHIKCTALNSGYSTTNNGSANMTMPNPSSPNNTFNLVIAGIPTTMNNPFSTGQDDQYHTTTCPTGTYARGIYIYSASQFDGGMFFTCTGIKAN